MTASARPPINPSSESIDSIAAYKIDQIELAQIRDQWILPPELSAKLARHYLLYWDKSHLQSLDALASNKIVEHQGCKYITILTAAESAFVPASRVVLSFRHPTGTKFGYVLISPAIRKYGDTNEH